MRSKPLTTRDLYLGGGVIGMVCWVLAAVIYPSILLFWMAIIFPLVFLTLHLTQLSTEYTEQTLCTIPTKVYSIFIGGSLLFVTVGVVNGFPIQFAIAVVSMIVVTIAPFYWFCTQISTAYDDVEFGFRSVLPNASLWKSATVFLMLQQSAKYRLSRRIWRWFAIGRFETLEDADNTLYSNTKIAHRYLEAFNNINSGDRIPDERVANILDAFSYQECRRCKQEYAVDEMYFITTDEQVTTAYCLLCLDEITPGDTDYASEKTESRQASEDAVADEINHELEFALDMLDFNSTAELTEASIRSAYREKVKEVHPDSGGSNEEFKMVQEARNILQSSL